MNREMKDLTIKEMNKRFIENIELHFDNDEYDKECLERENTLIYKLLLNLYYDFQLDVINAIELK